MRARRGRETRRSSFFGGVDGVWVPVGVFPLGFLFMVCLFTSVLRVDGIAMMIFIGGVLSLMASLSSGSTWKERRMVGVCGHSDLVV